MAYETSHWTLAELHRLPDDGNKYELVRGELFVTPPPSVSHESLASVLHARLHPYVERQQLGRIYRPRSVVRTVDSEVEPDLMVRPITESLPRKWEDAPLPILVVEILSDTTRRRDRGAKRDFYMDAGVPQYWIVDGEKRVIRVVAPARDDVVATESLVWQPSGATEPFMLDVVSFFREGLG